jgi:cysteine desulfurase
LKRIYLDHAATSPMHPKVIDVMVKAMNDYFGNPSSIHFFGRESRHILDNARQELASSIGAKPNEIIFTSGGTEADNLAILGVARANCSKGNHIITTTIEHHAVLHSCKQLEKEGFEVSYLPVDDQGKVSVDSVKNALRDDTILVTMMYGNNEVGSIQPIAEVGELLSSHQAIFHTDSVQAYGLEKINVNELKIDLLSVSAHKINGPKGIGFLYVRSGIKLFPSTYGGEQERKRRAGTENVAAIVGFQEAVKMAQAELEEKRKLYMNYKQILMQKLTQLQIDFSLNGSLENSLPHVLNLSFRGTDVESMLVNLDLAGIAVSSGSACTAGSIDPSHVLVAMFGKDSDRLANSIRFSFGITNTTAQIETVGEEIAKIVNRLINKSESPA